MADERNFRSAYYEKVGYRGVEEKKNLEILLKDKPLDLMKLRLFCDKFSIPSVYRSLVWSLLLGIYPIHTQNHKFVMEQREQQFKDLQQVIKIMRFVDEKTPKSQTFYAMYLLENRSLLYGTSLQIEHPFIDICSVLVSVFDKEFEIYWIAKRFYEQIRDIDMNELINLSIKEIETTDQKLFSHLEKFNILKQLPVKKWFENCFATIIMENSLMRIWDKLFGGSTKILVYVFCKLLYFVRQKLLICESATEAFAIIKPHFSTDQEIADQLVNKSIELYYKKH